MDSAAGYLKGGLPPTAGPLERLTGDYLFPACAFFHSAIE